MRRVEFYRHSLTESDIAAVADVLRSVFLTTGPRAGSFEKAFAEFLGVEHAVSVSSCTSALFLSLTALGIGPGDDVITTPMSFVATANAVIHTGATPVFVDVDPITGNIDPARVERAITSRTRAVIPVHLYGVMADMRALTDICRPRGIAIIEDAAHATEAERDGAKPGQLGNVSCFSFYATKNLTCGEGGAVATNDAGLADTIRRLRSHGLSKDAAGRYTERYQHWDMLDLGFKANLSDINAALLLGQLPRLHAQLEQREAIAQRYQQAFASVPGIDYPRVPAGARSARHLFTIWVPPAVRDEAIAALQAKGIGVAVNYRAMHLLSFYQSRFGFGRGTFPNAELIGDRTLTLPLYPSMSQDDVDTVIAAVREVAAGWSASVVEAGVAEAAVQ